MYGKKSVGDELEEDQIEHNVLILGGTPELAPGVWCRLGLAVF